MTNAKRKGRELVVSVVSEVVVESNGREMGTGDDWVWGM